MYKRLMEPKDRRILVIAGAGASRLLGRDNRPMPLMTDWAQSLREDLERAEPGAADVIGLFPDLPGDQFEMNLGEFLAFQRGLDLIEKMRRIGGTTAHDEPPGFQVWLPQARQRSEAIVEIIRKNLFRNFGVRRVDADLAKNAYGALLSLFKELEGATAFAFATTNYDPAIEVGLDALGFQTPDGFKSSRFQTDVLEPFGVGWKDWAENSIPVLHLHGAVGWYRTDAGPVVRFPADQGYNNTHGIPALMLPDSTKTADSFQGGEGLWSEFDVLLDRCTHVLFLGHSLHDRHIVEKINGAGKPTAVTWYPGNADNLPERFEEASLIHQDFLPEARTIAMIFGPELETTRKMLEAWPELDIRS